MPEALNPYAAQNSDLTPTLFYWQGEEVGDTTSIMHLEMTNLAYKQMMAVVAGSQLRVLPAQ